MVITSKRGQQENRATYEFICDAATDLQNIDPHQITLGSVAIVLQGESGNLEVYMANSKKEWIILGSSGSKASSESNPIADEGTADNMVLQE